MKPTAAAASAGAVPASSSRRALRTRASVSQACGGIPYSFLNARSSANGLVPSSAASASNVGGAAILPSSAIRARSASRAPPARGVVRGSTLPCRSRRRTTRTRSRLSAASALPSSAARCTWVIRRAAYGSVVRVSPNQTVPRSGVTSAAMSLTTWAEG